MTIEKMSCIIYNITIIIMAVILIYYFVRSKEHHMYSITIGVSSISLLLLEYFNFMPPLDALIFAAIINIIIFLMLSVIAMYKD